MAITFADIIPVKQVTSHEYTVNLEDAWCIGTVPNGGYVTSAFMIVARTHMGKTHAKQNQPDIINLHLEFLRRTSVGPATFSVRDVKIGSRISNLHITLRQAKDVSNPSSPQQDEVQGYLTLSNIENETGPSNTTNYRLHPAPLPVDLKQLASGSDMNWIRRRKDIYGNFRRASHHTASHLVKPARRTPELQNPAIVDQWVRFQPPDPMETGKSGRGTWTNDALGYLVDIFPQLHERFIYPKLEDSLLLPESEVSRDDLKKMQVRENRPKASFWYPTLLLNLDVKKKLPAQGLEWLFVRVRAKDMRNGRFDLQVEVWDDPIHGELVALSTHAGLIVDASRNLKSRKADGGKSKI